MSHQFVFALLTYLIAAASPGPSNMALMAVAMNQGRRAAIAMALGIMCGSMFWGVMAVIGFASLLTTYAQLLTALKMLGALYLFWLAAKALRSGLSASVELTQQTPAPMPLNKHIQRGLHLHLSNPKAIFTWLAIASLAANENGTWSDNVCLLITCMTIGATVFISYAIIFSSAVIRRWYCRWQRALNFLLALVFGVAAGKLMYAD